MTRGGRALARARAARLNPARLARHAAAARAGGGPSYAGEWAHLDALLHRLGLAEGGFAVDLAAGDGVNGSSTLPLFRDRGWSGLAIECDPARFALLSHAYAAFPRVRLSGRRVVPAEAADLLRRERVPHGFALLNLDIDSFDLEVAEALLPAFRPRVVDLEVNEKVPPPVRFAVRYTPGFRWDEGHCYGCSLSAAADVMEALGYRLEGLEHNNAFFVRADLAERAGVDEIAPEVAYRAGYLERPDRAQLFPWNHDMDDLAGLEAAEIISHLRKRFRRASASYALQLEPLGPGWALDVRAGGIRAGRVRWEGVGEEGTVCLIAASGAALRAPDYFGSPPPPSPTGEPDPPGSRPEATSPRRLA
jgi:hypothetical protein